MGFSERLGLTSPRVNIQRQSIDDKLKNALWNCVYVLYFNNCPKYINKARPALGQLFMRIWLQHYHQRFDEMPYLNQIITKIKITFFQAPWNEVYDLLEFIPNNYELPAFQGGTKNKLNIDFCNMCNDQMEINLSAYRFVDMNLSEITSNEEIESIEDVISSNALPPAKEHIKRALELYSDRINPDYRNSIKESISAVEAFCKSFTDDDKATLGKALGIMEKKRLLHGSLKAAFSSLYGYTSDAEGIRHALLTESDLKQEDAKFMLVACSAFINYLTVKIESKVD